VAWAEHTGQDMDAFPALDHLCRVRHCSQPTHLEETGQAENVRRGDTGLHNRRKTHCPAGHPYSGDNLRININGRRICAECRREADRRRYRRNRT
jgi:hypothetical protein